MKIVELAQEHFGVPQEELESLTGEGRTCGPPSLTCCHCDSAGDKQDYKLKVRQRRQNASERLVCRSVGLSVRTVRPAETQSGPGVRVKTSTVSLSFKHFFCCRDKTGLTETGRQRK